MAYASDSGAPLRDEMERMLSEKRHNFVEMVSGDGIRFNIVRRERIESFAVVRAPQR